MNIKSVRNMMTVVGLAVGFAATSPAQGTLKAVIGFPFVAQGAKMVAGTYIVGPVNAPMGSGTYQLRNIDTKKSILIRALLVGEVRDKSSNAPRLSFQCKDGDYCTLLQVWDGTPLYKVVSFPAKDGSPEQSLKEIALARR